MSAGGSESKGRDLASVVKPDSHMILIVDDDADIVDALADALTDEGYGVAVAKDGLEALRYLSVSPAPCLILLDWMMPYCDGPTFRQRQLADMRLRWTVAHRKIDLSYEIFLVSSNNCLFEWAHSFSLRGFGSDLIRS